MKKRNKKENVIVVGVKYRFYPTKAQIEYINGMFGARRIFWNKILEKYNLLYEEDKAIKKYNETAEIKKERIHYNLMCGPNPNTQIYNIGCIIKDGLSNLDENGESSPKDYSWLKKYPLMMYESTVADLGLAWDKYFEYLKNLKNGNNDAKKEGKPQKKRKGEVSSVRLRNTGTLVDGKNIVDWKKGLIKTPGFRNLGYCKCVLHKKFRGKVKHTTISRDIGDKYYISLTLEINGSYPKINDNVTEENAIGIDFGLKTFASISNADDNENGKKINFKVIDKINKLYNKIKKLQRQMTKCCVTLSREGCEPYTILVSEMNKREQENRNAFKGWHKEFSKGYDKYELKKNKLQVQINNIKDNYIGEFASTLAKDDNVNAITVETLGFGDMTERNKTKIAKGKRLSKKNKFRKGTARNFAKVAIGKTISQLEYDCKKEGKAFVKAPRMFASTKICSCCGYKLPSIDLGTRKWVCPNCGKEHDRDINAAKNLAQYGLKVLTQKKHEEQELVMAESAV